MATGLDPVLLPVLQSRVDHLRAEHPEQLMARATHKPASQLPLDGPISDNELRAAGTMDGDQWMVVGRASDAEAPSWLLGLIVALQ